MKLPLGQFSREPDGYRVRFERVYPHSIEKVWEAITNPDQLRIWFNDIELDFQPEGKMIIRFRDEARTESFGRIIRIDPPHRFEWMWEEELATWELESLGDHTCKLTLTYSKLPLADYTHSVPAGWHTLLDQLREVLAGRSEPYPFGSSDPETLDTGLMNDYTQMIFLHYPELKPQS